MSEGLIDDAGFGNTGNSGYVDVLFDSEVVVDAVENDIVSLVNVSRNAAHLCEANQVAAAEHAFGDRRDAVTEEEAVKVEADRTDSGARRYVIVQHSIIEREWSREESAREFDTRARGGDGVHVDLTAAVGSRVNPALADGAAETVKAQSTHRERRAGCESGCVAGDRRENGDRGNEN